MADFGKLATAIAALTAQVASTEGTEASAVALINGFSAQISAAVQAALTADNNADEATIAAAQTAIDEVTARFAASGNLLGAAVANNQ